MGIGAAIARALAGRGFRCVLLARRREPLEALAAELGGEAEVCDVADREAVDATAVRVAERHPAIHVLVLNAGMPGGGGFLDLAAERIEQVTAVNYLGSVWALRAFLPLLERGAPSDVVTIASIAGTTVPMTTGPYAASKHAQLAFSRSVAGELGPRGIRIHAVNPGPVPTDAFPQTRTLANPVTRHAVVSPERVARAVLRAIDHDRREIFVPWPLRAAAALQGLAPGTMSRLAARLRVSRREERGNE
jgi:short-subunit dehydrogenase